VKEVMYVSKKEQAALALIVGLAIGVLAQRVVSKEAAVLGLSAFEIALLGVIAGGVGRRLA
jgi:hypothetical protein